MSSIRLITCSANPNRSELINAHLLSRDSQVIQGNISMNDGVIVLEAPSEKNVALCLLYDAGNSGRLMLQTGILPPRERPYMLSQELARHRIKLFLDMSENWSLFHLPDDHPAVKKWEESRLLFTESLTSNDVDHAGELARQALDFAIRATERLALAHAQMLLYKRYGKKPVSSSALGVRVHPSRFDEPLRSLIKKNIDIVTIPIPWNQIEPTQGNYDWEPVDRWIQWVQSVGKHSIAGPIIDFTTKGAIPEWVRKHQHDYPTFRDTCYSHLEKVVRRYGGAISFWNIISGINMNSEVRLTLDNMVDLIRTASLLVKQARRDARVMIEITHPFSEFVFTNYDACNASVFLTRLAQEGVKLDALGVQILVGEEGGRSARDLMLLSAKLDEFLHVDFRVIISAFGSPSEILDNSFGWWKTGFSEHTQEKWGEHMFAIALSKPFVDSVIWTDLFDHAEMDIQGSGLISKDGKPKSVLQRLIKMRNRLRKPLGNLELFPKDQPEETDDL